MITEKAKAKVRKLLKEWTDEMQLESECASCARLEKQVIKFRGLFLKAQGMLDIDEIKRLRHITVKQAMQIKELEELKGIRWPSIDLPIM